MTNHKTPQTEQTGLQAKSLQKNSPQNNVNQVHAQPMQDTAKESKPAYQTYIYRSYGGGYQGL